VQKEEGPLPHQGGSAIAGFEIKTDHAERVVLARMWGLWPVGVCHDYGAALVKELDASASPDYWLLFDASACPPQGPDAQTAIIEAWHLTNRYRMRGRIVLVDNPLTRLQVRRLLAEGGFPAFLLAKTEAEARALRAAPAR
jgi:hypothetical protein